GPAGTHQPPVVPLDQMRVLVGDGHAAQLAPLFGRRGPTTVDEAAQPFRQGGGRVAHPATSSVRGGRRPIVTGTGSGSTASGKKSPSIDTAEISGAHSVTASSIVCCTVPMVDGHPSSGDESRSRKVPPSSSFTTSSCLPPSPGRIRSRARSIRASTGNG